MKIWKDKEGKKVGYKEFVSRWKEGISEITPLQQTWGQIQATWIILLGVTLGLVISIYNWRNAWWLCIVLTGVLFNTLIQMLGLYQKRGLLRKFDIQEEEMTREVENE
tara:strand:+ start:5 stop:328 length:324 start_codon:yes stop_codon:yes gene_type:complete